MTDRYKATSGVRAAPDQSSPGREFDLDKALGREDPLVELARIVAGRPPADGTIGRRTLKPIPVPGPDLAGELEAELLGGLKASGTVTPLRKVPDPANDWPAPAVPSFEEAVAPTEDNRAPMPDFAGLGLRRGGDGDKRVLPLKPRETKAPRVEPEPPPAPRSSESGPARPDLPIRAPRPVAAQKPKESARSSDDRKNDLAARAASVLAWVANDEAPARATPPAAEAPSPAVGRGAESADPGDPVEAFFRQLPEGSPAAGRDAPAPALGDDFFAPYEGAAGGATAPPTAPDDDLAAALGALEPVPGYGPSDAEPMRGPQIHGRRRLMLGVSALVVALLLGGGMVVAFQFRGAGPVGDPPIIAADTRNTKIAAPAPAGNADAQVGKLINDRVESPPPGQGGIRVISTSPASAAAKLPDVGGNALPGGKDVTNIIGGSDQTAADRLGEGRPVRTITVDKEGTPITANAPRVALSGPVTPANSIAPLANQVAAPATPGPTAGTNAVRTVTSVSPPNPVGPVANVQGLSPTVVPAATADAASQGGANANTSAGPRTRGFNDFAAPPAINTPPPVTSPANAGPRPGAAPAPTGEVATRANAAAANTPPRTTAFPADTEATSRAAPPPVVRGADGFIVQVASQKSESLALASFKDLQKRYPSFLGDKQPDVQPAEIAGRGTFYRVRVGPVTTRDAAVALCEGLKGAGADCIVVRN